MRYEMLCNRFVLFCAIILLVLSVRVVLSQQDVADVRSKKLYADGDSNKQYFLIGPKKGMKAPKEGFSLLIVMPGGDGGSDFHPFVKRIFKNALPGRYIVAQPVSVKWTTGQKIVWPTKISKVKEQKFSTEEFVEAVIKEVKKKHKINNRHIFTLTWSSSGPAAYAILLRKDKSVTGSFLAMSVFKPRSLPPLGQAKGHACFLYHSPDDRVCPFRMAKEAERRLSAAGAKVKLFTYQGGHGWRGNVYSSIHQGIDWLEEQQKTKPAAAQRAGDGRVDSRSSDSPTSLIENGGFEKGRRGWMVANNSRRMKLASDRKDKYEGQRSLKISKRGGMPVDIIRQNVSGLAKGGKLSVSAMVKAQKATNAWLKFYVWDASEQVLVKDVDVSRIAGTFDWKKLEKTFAIPPEADLAALQFWMVMDGTVWLDDVRISPVGSKSHK
ncbi:MAG: carbohydrate binding domain-containing protein [Planctomycetota bacterium]|jgi:predicted esterase